MLSSVRLIFLVAALFSAQLLAQNYSEQELKAYGISSINGMHYCAANNKYARPNKVWPDVSICGYATRARKICANSDNTMWISGRCFCPEANIYLDHLDRTANHVVKIGLDSRASLKALEALADQVARCPAFTPRNIPVARTVYLVPRRAGFFVKKMHPSSNWDDRRDYPGEQGNPLFPVTIARTFNIAVGFDWHNDPVIPSFKRLKSRLAAIADDVGFFEVEGELTGISYLREFINGRLPIARIDDANDATYFLHDMNFHVMGFILLPAEIRELAQRQTRYLLEFAEYCLEKHPQNVRTSRFKLLLHRILEDQIQRIDLATGNLTQALYKISEENKHSPDFLNSLAQLSQTDQDYLRNRLMAIIGDNQSESLSVRDFLHNKADLIISYNRMGEQTWPLINALRGFIKTKEGMAGFHDEISGETAVSLLIERAKELRKDNS